MVAFGFLSQNFERWWGPINGTLSFYEYMLSGRDTQTLLQSNLFELFALIGGGGDAKTLILYPLATSHP